MAKMNSNIQQFKFAEGIVVRSVVDTNGSPWFVAADVCAALEMSNTAKSVSRLDDDEKGVTSSDTLGGKQELTTINESGLYSLILTSRKAEAKRFKKWVTAEVLPAIRKTGGYGEAKPTKATHPALEDKTVNHIWLVMNDSDQVMESIPMRDVATVRTQVDKHFPTAALLERGAVIEDLDHVAYLLLEMTSRVKNTLNPLITALGTTTHATQSEATARGAKLKPVDFVIRDLAEMTEAPMDHEDTIVVSMQDIENVVKRNFEELMKFVEKIAGCDGSMIEGNAAARKARELLGLDNRS